MIIVTLGLLIFATLWVLFEKKVLQMIIWFFVFSAISAFSFFLLGSPDVAMAEAAISSFSGIIFIVCFEKFFDIFDLDRTRIEDEVIRKEKPFKRYFFPTIVAISLCGLFFYFIPYQGYNSLLKKMYLTSFMYDIGGENAVTSIYLGYRLYDTLFEALMLVITVVAITHMSHTNKLVLKDGRHSEIEKSNISNLILRTIAPMCIVFGIYLIANGFLTAGGGFQGGLAVATFFICRFLIYDVYDLPIEKINKLEEVFFILLILTSAGVIFQDSIHLVPNEYVSLVQNTYLILMNLFIGVKVACGFVILFYRYVAIERN